jgi:hypothetical protein
MPRLTKRAVEAVSPAKGKPVIAWDDQVPGFGIKVLPSGTRKYLVKYRTQGGGRRAQQRWYVLGTHGAITCEQAREMAKAALASVAVGLVPKPTSIPCDRRQG